MRARIGFVSNSSSSSFIVHVKGDGFFWPKLRFITPAQERRLLKFGFKYTDMVSPNGYDMTDPKMHPRHAAVDRYHLGYSMDCNQDDAKYLLCKHGIPFMASIHYDEMVYVWNGRSKVITVYPNIGIACSYWKFRAGLFGTREARQTLRHEREWCKEYTIGVKKFLRDNEKFMRELKKLKETS